MTYKIFDLPSHILVIHLVVVGIPVAGLATVGMAVRPQWRSGKAGLAIIIVDALAVVGTYIARITGEQFFNNQPGLRTLKQVIDHKNLGMTLIWYVLGLLVAAILLVLAEKYERPPLTTVFAIIATVAAVAAVVQTVRVGDAGARATWSGYIR
ncbi:hypothetical protein KGQ20_22325 [Catenulispora sp. NF23]|uniref:DUF2231 domain-containing protein n=1 Tax=Catenulispora pinistramenti TaxID=2705254 RepID=A0ABS5KKF3_9ACTN|nr:DUF2231 domain-containing protein [Catenulispora pinistramenti]MBS2535502.1 hypothetical protein [Catenulispora pinistramenti]MBS2546259.1 hypothetical protein [Catenulispora pinistramenti]